MSGWSNVQDFFSGLFYPITHRPELIQQQNELYEQQLATQQAQAKTIKTVLIVGMVALVVLIGFVVIYKIRRKK